MAGVIKVVKKLPKRKVPGVDEICPEMLKALNTVVQSWLTHLFKRHREEGNRTYGVANQVVAFYFQKVEPHSVLQLPRYHTAQPPRERVFQGAERRL